MNKTILKCEDSPEGIFSAVYSIWEWKLNRENIGIIAGEIDNYELFAEYLDVKTDFERAMKVARTISNRFGNEAYNQIIQAACANDSTKSDAIFRTIEKGLRLKNPQYIMRDLGDINICRVFELDRAVNFEKLHLYGFVRFTELYNGILCSIIEPKHNQLTVIAPHFADRFPNENWIIYDKKRKYAVVNKAYSGYGAVKGDELNLDMLTNISEREEEFQKLWCSFFKTIAIEERNSKHRQRQMLPLRFRENMIEFCKL